MKWQRDGVRWGGGGAESGVERWQAADGGVGGLGGLCARVPVLRW